MSSYKQEGRTGMYQSLLWCLAVSNSSHNGYVDESWGEFHTYFKNNYLGVLWDEAGMERVATKVIKICEHGIPDAWQQEWTRIDRDLTKESLRMSRIDLTTLTAEELKREYDLMFKLDQEMWAVSIFIDTFDPGFDQKEIERRAQLHGLSEHDMHVLLTPHEPSYLYEWETSLEQVRAGAITRDALRERFYWFATNYFSFGELTDEFIDGALAHGRTEEFASVADEERTILAARRLSENPLAFFRSLTTWRDTRKRLNYTGIYGLVRILREVMRQHGIDPDLVNGLRIDQVDDLFGGNVPESTLRAQFEDSVLLRVTGDGQYAFSYGPDAADSWQKITTADHMDVTELKGMVASKGKAQGLVRVVLEAHHASAKLMQMGEILVTSMTRPEFVPLMRLAGAIVTNEGGITSHAAIVSRELGKPCVIGTRSATTVLRDGDLVEVDAEKGIVRKL